MQYNKYPYLIDQKGNTKELAPKGIIKTVTLSRENQHKTNYRDFNTTEILDGEQYYLVFWEEKWKPIGKATAKNGTLKFTNVPANGLYLLLTKTPDNFERIFTIDEDTDRIFWY